MTKQNSTLSKRLKQYSAVAGSLLAGTGLANAQMVYTDIDPDFVLNAVNGFPGDTYPLDLNNDGTTDFTIFAFDNGTVRGEAAVMNYTNTNSNAIVGSIVSFGTKPFLYPSALALNDNIDGNQPFHQLSELLFVASGSYHFFLPGMATYYTASGNTPNAKWPDGADHYLGLKFTDGTDYFYGWARCNVAADGSSVTIKDMAYNATPNTGVFAGQGSPLGINTVNQSSNFNVFGYEGVVNVFVNDGNVKDANITVTNALGETVVKQSLTNRNSRIDLNQFAKGIYMVTIQRGDEIFSKKVSFR